MADATIDIVAMGDAIVDVIASCEDEFLIEHRLPKGSMQLLSPEQADALYAAMGVAREMSGGSAANSMAGIAAMGAPGWTGSRPTRRDSQSSRSSARKPPDADRRRHTFQRCAPMTTPA